MDLFDYDNRGIDEMAELQIKEKDGKIFCPLTNRWNIATPEEKVRQKWVVILVNEYGYSLDQMAQELKVSNSKRGQGKAKADIVVWASKEDKVNSKAAFIVVECKAETVKIHPEDYYQGFNYAAWAHADFFITSNQKETKYFNVDPNYLPQKLQEVVNIPNATEANNKKKVEELKNKTKIFTREEFTRTLKACHNIIRNNDKLSPEAAFDEISKLLFMKIRYERKNKGIKVFTREQYENESKKHEEDVRPGLKGTPQYNLSYMQFLFATTKEYFKEDRLFDDNDQINIREDSFKQILEKLETYNLSDTQDDVKGIAFEQFLGTTFRGELGQFFTPRTIVDFMTEILDPQEGEVICDPTCGSGGFLIKAFEYIREKIETDIRQQKAKFRNELEGKDYEDKSEKEQIKINHKIEEMQNALNTELDTSVKDSRMYKLSHNCIFGTDANPRMARTSKMNMIMHGDGHGGVHHHDGLLNVNGIFEDRFDVILTNPPFGQNVDKKLKITESDKFTDEAMIKKYRQKFGSAYDEAMKQVDDNIGEPLIKLYDNGAVSTLTEVLFMERCLRLLKKGGRMGIVLPEGVLNNKQLQVVREYFEGRAKLLLICSIPQDVFIAAGATVKPSLVFMKKFTEEEEKQYAKCQQAAFAEANKNHKQEIDNLSVRKSELIADKETLGAKLKLMQKDLKNAQKTNGLVEKYSVIVADTKKDIEVNKSEQKALEIAVKQLKNLIDNEAKVLTKRKFDYDVPIAKIDDAGITSTGAESENNQLPELVKEYCKYRIDNSLWSDANYCISYKDVGTIRVINGVEETFNG